MFARKINLTCLVTMLIVIRASAAIKCGVADFLEQLIESMNTMQGDRQSCRSIPEPKVGKAGPQGAPGPRGPPGIADMSAIEERIQQMIDENREYLMRQGEMCYLGMKSRHIPDAAITASSSYDNVFAPYRARLDNQVGANHAGCWAAKSNAVGQWLQIDLGDVKEMAGIVTQSRPAYHQYVSSYKVSCGADIEGLSVVKSIGGDEIYDGNRDVDIKVYNRFPEVLSCRYIRIYPQSWNIHMAMRVELVSGACFNYTVPW